MVKRLFWLGLGLAAGAIVVHRVARRAQKFTPGGIADSARKNAVGAAGSARSFVSEVFDAMHEREAEIHAAIAEGHTVELAGDDEDGDADDIREGGHRR